MKDIKSCWEYIKSAKTEVKKELVKRLEQAIKSETEREELYKDPRWKKKRLEILKRDKYKCQICGCNAQDVHHIKYINSYNAPWDIENDYLVSLCKKCHYKFDGTSSDDYIFIPASQPILLRKYDDECCHLYGNEVLEIPLWKKVKPVLESFTHRTNYPIKDLELAIYYPLSSKIWQKYVMKDFEGCDELDVFVDSIRYAPEKIKSTIHSFEIWKNSHPFLAKNYNFVNSQLRKFYELSLLTPQKGIFALTVRNKKKGYYIRLIDIEKKEIVKHFDFSDNNDYKEINFAELCRIGVLYGIDYLQKQSKPLELPIFSTNSCGLVEPYHYRNFYIEYANSLSLSPVEKWKFEIMKGIGPEHHCKIFQWNKKLWGNEPICND